MSIAVYIRSHGEHRLQRAVFAFLCFRFFRDDDSSPSPRAIQFCPAECFAGCLGKHVAFKVHPVEDRQRVVKMYIIDEA